LASGAAADSGGDRPEADEGNNSGQQVITLTQPSLRGDRQRAREHWQKSLDFAQRAGMAQRVAQVKQWLDDLDKPPAS
jgi:hypothetical protein